MSELLSGLAANEVEQGGIKPIAPGVTCDGRGGIVVGNEADECAGGGDFGKARDGSKRVRGLWADVEWRSSGNVFDVRHSWVFVFGAPGVWTVECFLL